MAHTIEPLKPICGCYVFERGSRIHYCPLHAAAPLGDELADLVLGHDNGEWTPTVAEWKAIVAKGKQFKAKAEGRE